MREAVVAHKREKPRNVLMCVIMPPFYAAMVVGYAEKCLPLH